MLYRAELLPESLLAGLGRSADGGTQRAGFERMVAQLDPALQKFYAQPFLASGWYDLAPLVAMAPVCGAALGISAEISGEPTGLFRFAGSLV